MTSRHRKHMPVIHPSAIIAEGAVVTGDVVIGPDTVVMSNAVITSQGTPVRIGRRCIIMENVVVRGAGVHPCEIADHVLVGPHAYVSGATVGRECFVAARASIFNGAVLEAGSLVAIGAIVHITARCPASTFIPMGHMAIGDPLKIYSPAEALQAHKDLCAIGFTKVIFGFDSSDMTNGAATRALCDRYIRGLRRHFAGQFARGKPSASRRSSSTGKPPL